MMDQEQMRTAALRAEKALAQETGVMCVVALLNPHTQDLAFSVTGDPVLSVQLLEAVVQQLKNGQVVDDLKISKGP